jgi:Bacterial EndoU nuclease
VQERIERADATDEPAQRIPEHARDDLRQRLDRLADGHPSSDQYRYAHPGWRDGRADTSLADADREEVSGAQTSREQRTGTRRDDSLHASERASSAWESGEVRGHPDRPAEHGVQVTADRARHVLDGSPGSDGGGHRHGTGRPAKTEFPKDWSDDVIVSVVEDVGRRPDHVEWQPNGRWRVSGDHDGVRVSAVVLPDGRIWTAWPEPGGKGVVQNPEAS